MRTRLSILFAAILLIVLSACGGDGKQAKVAGDSKDAVKAEQVAEPSQPKKQGKAQNKTENKTSSSDRDNGSKGGNSPTKPFPTPSLPPNTMPLKVELTPTCGSHGTLMTLKIETRKTVSLSLAVAYSDYRGPYWVGHADDQGRFTYTWVIEPEAAMGDGMVFVGVGDSSTGPDEYSAYSTGESAREIVRFRVATRC